MNYKLQAFPAAICFLLYACNNDAGKTTVTQANAPELFQPKALTPPKSFTAGAEGPAVDKWGNIYAVNLQQEGTIGKISAAGDTALWLHLPGGSVGNGIRFNSRGVMLIADYTNHNILQADTATKGIKVYAHEPRMNQPNDIAIDSRDRVYASDPNWKNGTGNIWRIDTDGTITLLEENMGTTNGIEISADEKTLYVAESVQRKVWAYDLSEVGSISNKRILLQFPDYGLDGMRCDAKGNLFITRHGKGTVVQVAPDGKIVREIQLKGKLPSNIAFGGKDGQTAYVTLQDNGNIETFLTDTPGREWTMMHRK